MQIIIDNPSLEARLLAKSKELKIKINDLVERLLSDKIEEEQTFHYKKKDPYTNIKKLEYSDDTENTTNPFQDINDVIAYSKELRKNAWR